MPKRIMYVEANADGTIGGSHYSLLALVQHLDRDRYDPLVILYQDTPVVPLFRAACPVMIVNFRDYFRWPVPWVRKPLNAVRHLWIVLRCVAIILKERIDLVHLSNSPLAGVDTWLLACLLTGVPCVSHERGFSAAELSGRPLMRRLLAKYRRVICVSEAMRRNLIDRGFDARQVITIHNGIDAEAYRQRIRRTPEQVRAEFGLKPGAPFVGLVGNIRRWKGQTLLIEALRTVLPERPDFVCLLVGEVATDSNDDARYAMETRDMIARYGMEGKCALTGYRADIPDLMNAFDVVVNASILPDPFPRVILEAMAVGRPVIATDLGGAVESVVEGETGFLVPADGPAVLAARLLRLISEPALRLKMASAAAARAAVFDIGRTASLTQDVYDELLRPEGRRPAGNGAAAR